MGKAVLNLEGLKKTEDKPENSPFILRSGNERTNFAKKLVMPKMIMGELLYEQTVTMLFAETGVGKSMLAFQLANAITRGESVLGLKNESSAQPILFLDFENGEKVFEKRYSEQSIIEGKEIWHNHFDWDEKAYFIDPKGSNEYTVPSKNATEWWFKWIKEMAKKAGAKIIFIDNLFSLIQEGGIESTKEVKPLLTQLLDMKKAEGWTVIVIHHTPKRSNGSLSRNDLAGSSNLSNLVDAVIGIGKSYYNDDESSRYIKQIKPPRFTETIYGEFNVISAKIERIRPNFLGFSKVDLMDFEQEFKNESEHLKNPNQLQGKDFPVSITEERRDAVKEKLINEPDFNRTQLADEWETSRQTIDKDIKIVKQANGELFNNYGK